jgi:hypothetical protein
VRNTRIRKGNTAYYANAKLLKSRLLKRSKKKTRIHLTLRPVVIYATEAWTLTEMDEIRLRIFERQILRKISGPIQSGKDIWRIRNKTELDHLISGADIVSFIKAHRIKWSGHVESMDTSRIAKKSIRMETNGDPTTERSRLRWLDDVCDHLKVPKVSNCKELAMDRKDWSDLFEKAKTHKGL